MELNIVNVKHVSDGSLKEVFKRNKVYALFLVKLLFLACFFFLK